MIINVTNLINEQSIDVSFKDLVSLPKSYVSKTDILVEVRGTLTKNKDVYAFSGKVNTVLSFNCDLCLKPFSVNLSFCMDEAFSKSVNEDDEIWLFEGDSIDLKPAVISNILLNIPMRAVCSDDCKGLCPVCGHDLNQGECGCDLSYVNPKFEKLKTLFDDKEV